MAEIETKGANTKETAALPKASFFGFLKNAGKKFNLKLINVFLLLCILALGFYFINYCFASLEYIKNIEFKMLEDISEQPDTRQGLGSKIMSFYTQKMGERDIFRMGLKPKVPAFIEDPSSKATEATANLRLVGISWSAEPDAIIEDTKLGHTFFVKKGSKIKDITVENIFRDRVVLSYEKELIELK